MSRELMCKHGLWPHENCKGCAKLERERDHYKDLRLNRDLSLGVTYRDKVEQQVCPKCNQEMGNPHHCRPDWSGPSIGGKEVSND